ncbi:hypothetical protein AJ80_00497 [Polytolypa hystricis UAMH7299]|uniref:Peroxisomal biogenesis factor 11 n=1 Tax=Polytolypa hystricis (strain UAMH7299) TaxID=1447883 RepID=A0A2B7Z2T0_POLH7|nr:hypothetical protein AJ80_00497 [Polytolypa hystricis UAMH7299]
MISPLKQFTNYTNAGPGLENFLRLIQSICQVVATLSASSVAFEKWTIAWQHLALSRRYFRYFQFIDCFDNAWSAFSDQGTSKGYVLRTLEAGRWSGMGGYLLLEALTILDALKIWETTWAKQVFIESYKLWFYGLTFYLAATVWQLLGLPGTPGNTTAASSKSTSSSEKTSSNGNAAAAAAEKDTKENAAAVLGKGAGVSRQRLMKDLVVAGCDILIPGSTLGWIDVSFLTVASTAVLTSVLVGQDRWAKIQGR